MKRKSFNIVFGLLIIVSAVLFSVCGSSPKSEKGMPLYDNIHYLWAYQYTNGITSVVDTQISTMEEKKEESMPGETSILGLPPGFYAHLGMLYTLKGNKQTATHYYQMEKSQFPESAHFMDFLITGNRRSPAAASGELDYPRSILILPVVNQSANVDAPTKSFADSATKPFTQAGYYVLPLSITTQVFEQNGITIADEAHNLPPARLRQIFGADAALYIVIAKSGLVLGTAEVMAACKLVDLRTGEDLWISTGSAREEVTTNKYNRGFLGDLTAAFLGDTAGNVVGTVNAARNVDYNVLGIRASGSLFNLRAKNNSLPYGPYHPLYECE